VSHDCPSQYTAAAAAQIVNNKILIASKVGIYLNLNYKKRESHMILPRRG
jgi:hypothetical protein